MNTGPPNIRAVVPNGGLVECAHFNRAKRSGGAFTSSKKIIEIITGTQFLKGGCIHKGVLNAQCALVTPYKGVHKPQSVTLV